MKNPESSIGHESKFRKFVNYGLMAAGLAGGIYGTAEGIITEYSKRAAIDEALKTSYTEASPAEQIVLAVDAIDPGTTPFYNKAGKAIKGIIRATPFTPEQRVLIKEVAKRKDDENSHKRFKFGLIMFGGMSALAWGAYREIKTKEDAKDEAIRSRHHQRENKSLDKRYTFDTLHKTRSRPPEVVYFSQKDMKGSRSRMNRPRMRAQRGA